MIAVVDYDTGNLRSVADALRRAGAEFTLTADPALLRGADKVILPGVGEASSAMSQLRERVGDVPTEMFRHFFHSFACAARCNLQISARGDNDHHKAEAVFKAFARALRMAVAHIPFGYTVPSSKGVL